MSEQEIVIVCKSAREPLKTGAKTGFRCDTCPEPLQITAGTEAVLRSCQARLLCNDCGLLYVNLCDMIGTPGDLKSSTAKAQIDAWNDSKLANWIRKRAWPVRAKQ